MRTFLRVALVLGSVALIAPVGAARADSVQGAPAPAQQQPSGKTPRQPANQGRQAPSGEGQQAKQTATSEAGDIVQLVEQALSGIDLRPDQTDALQKVGADVDAKVAAVDQARRDLLSALADQIEAGKVDADALQPQMKKVEDAAKAASPDLRSALEKVHDILDPAQRGQFVENFRAALKAHARQLDAKAQVDEWATALNLSDDQKQKIKDIVSEDTVADDVARARLELVLAAFPGDTFSMDDLLPERGVRHRTERMLDRIVQVTGKITDVLTPDQRKTAAARIRGRLAGQAGGGTTGAPPPEQTGTTSQGIWVGHHATVGYRRASGYGFVGGDGAGYGGLYML